MACCSHLRASCCCAWCPMWLRKDMSAVCIFDVNNMRSCLGELRQMSLVRRRLAGSYSRDSHPPETGPNPLNWQKPPLSSEISIPKLPPNKITPFYLNSVP